MAKEKKKKGIAYRIIMAILLIIIAFCVYKIGTILYEYYAGTREYDSVSEDAGTKDFTGVVDFDALRKKNPDVKAWLYSKDTPINYPVVQGDDNDYYLYRTFLRTYNGKGSLFIDYRCDEPFKQFNTIIYGHRMKDGSMFNSLTKYRDSAGYFDQHKKMMLVTPEGKYDVYVFAVLTIPGDSHLYKTAFRNDSDKQKYLDYVLENNEVNTGVGADINDQIVMMSTCTYEFDNARLVVYGKLSELQEVNKGD